MIRSPRAPHPLRRDTNGRQSWPNVSYNGKIVEAYKGHIRGHSNPMFLAFVQRANGLNIVSTEHSRWRSGSRKRSRIASRPQSSSKSASYISISSTLRPQAIIEIFIGSPPFASAIVKFGAPTNQTNFTMAQSDQVLHR